MIIAVRSKQGKGRKWHLRLFISSFCNYFPLFFLEKEMSYWQKSICIIKFHVKKGQKIVSLHYFYDARKNRFNILPFCAIKRFSGEEISLFVFSHLIYAPLT